MDKARQDTHSLRQRDARRLSGFRRPKPDSLLEQFGLRRQRRRPEAAEIQLPAFPVQPESRAGLGESLRQQLLEHVIEIPGQPQHGIERRRRAGVCRRFPHLFHVIVDERNLRRDADTHRNTGIGQRTDGAQSPVWRRCPWLQRAGQCGIERGDGHIDRREILVCHRRKQVDIALDATVLGDDGQRMFAS